MAPPHADRSGFVSLNQALNPTSKLVSGVEKSVTYLCQVHHFKGSWFPSRGNWDFTAAFALQSSRDVCRHVRTAKQRTTRPVLAIRIFFITCEP